MSGLGKPRPFRPRSATPRPAEGGPLRSPTRLWRLLLLTTLIALLPQPASPETFSHRDWTAVLERFVDERGRVDYDGLARDRGALDGYLARLAADSPESRPSLFPTRNDQLAYWINAYNAVVVQGVLDRGVDTPSVWGDGWFGMGFFTVSRADLGGARLSLQQLEDDFVRDRFRDPRVHASLNCASIGCPRLPRRAFEGPTLDADLEAAMRELVADPRHCRVDAASRRVWLSKIFDWFEDDFLDSERERGVLAPTILDFVNRFRAPGTAIPTDFGVHHLPYDKRLNRQSPAR